MFKRKEQRRRFTREEKEQMLSKSNGKCAHCGKGGNKIIIVTAKDSFNVI
jgi:hypothetical protein